MKLKILDLSGIDADPGYVSIRDSSHNPHIKLITYDGRDTYGVLVRIADLGIEHHLVALVCIAAPTSSDPQFCEMIDVLVPNEQVNIYVSGDTVHIDDLTLDAPMLIHDKCGRHMFVPFSILMNRDENIHPQLVCRVCHPSGYPIKQDPISMPSMPGSI